MRANGRERGGATVMVVDDEGDIRQLLRELLRRDGYTVIEAADGEEAVGLAARERPHVILMDIAMPGVDGLTAVWHIRRLAGMREVPVVIVSAFDTYELRAEAAGAGCAGYLVKPVEPEKLSALVGQLLREGCAKESPPDEAVEDVTHDTILARPTLLTVLERLHRLETRLSARLDKIEGEAMRIRAELKALREGGGDR